ncbi:MAG TPA: helix-turn-helix domain-containing protein, partial [Mycobacterium sp.]|nr:helix-turn-helix domain-containing protein [Mycobacterium sp.]
MRELSVAEQRYQAVLAVISDGLSICQVASKVGVSRQTLHSWLVRYEAEGLDGLRDPESRYAGRRYAGFRLHQTAMYLESQTQFGDILRPRKGPAGVLLDPAQAMAHS